MDWSAKSRLYAGALAAAGTAVFFIVSAPALAADQIHDEIQAYNAEIAEVGQWTYQQHLN